MQRSAFCDDQLRLQAVMGEFRGWMTATSFGNIDEELASAVHHVALFDHSMFGRLEVTGADRLDLLHRLSTNSLDTAKPGDVRSTVFATDKGRIIDHVVVVVKDDALLLVVSPGSEEHLMRWIEKFTITEDITLRSVTSSSSMVSLIGSTVLSAMMSLFGTHLSANSVSIADAEELPVQLVTPQMGNISIAHIIVRSPESHALFRWLDAQRDSVGARWAGSQAYEAFRISRGIPSKPGELAEAFNPLEAGLRESVSFTKGCYIGQEVIARLDTYNKVRRGLCGFWLDGPVSLSGGRRLLHEGTFVGTLTSVSEVPVRGRYPGMGIVQETAVVEGEIAQIEGSEVRALRADFPLFVG